MMFKIQRTIHYLVFILGTSYAVTFNNQDPEIYRQDPLGLVNEFTGGTAIDTFQNNRNGHGDKVPTDNTAAVVNRSLEPNKAEKKDSNNIAATDAEELIAGGTSESISPGTSEHATKREAQPVAAEPEQTIKIDHKILNDLRAKKKAMENSDQILREEDEETKNAREELEKEKKRLAKYMSNLSFASYNRHNREKACAAKREEDKKGGCKFLNFMKASYNKLKEGLTKQDETVRQFMKMIRAQKKYIHEVANTYLSKKNINQHIDESVQSESPHTSNIEIDVKASDKALEKSMKDCLVKPAREQVKKAEKTLKKLKANLKKEQDILESHKKYSESKRFYPKMRDIARHKSQNTKELDKAQEKVDEATKVLEKNKVWCTRYEQTIEKTFFESSSTCDNIVETENKEEPLEEEEKVEFSQQLFHEIMGEENKLRENTANSEDNIAEKGEEKNIDPTILKPLCEDQEPVNKVDLDLFIKYLTKERIIMSGVQKGQKEPQPTNTWLEIYKANVGGKQGNKKTTETSAAVSKCKPEEEAGSVNEEEVRGQSCDNMKKFKDKFGDKTDYTDKQFKAKVEKLLNQDRVIPKNINNKRRRLAARLQKMLAK